MPTRVEELASMRAPNQSGVDTSAVLKALAGNPDVVETPTTYAYGMNVGDAQKEAQLGAQAQQQRQAAVQDTRNAAMQQDQQLFDMAMKANAQYMAERDQAVRERVAAAEIAYKNAKMQGIPAELEAQRLANEKLMLDIEREKQMDALTIDIPDPANPGQTRKMPVRAFMGAGGKNVLSYMTGANLNETATERTIRKKAEIYASKGIPQDDAYLLAASKPELTFSQISRSIEASVKNRQPKNSWEKPNYGSKGTTPDGKPIPRTVDDFKAEEYNRLIDVYLPMLSEEARAKLKAWGPGALGMLDSPPSQGDEGVLSQESIDALTRSLIDAYK